MLALVSLLFLRDDLAPLRFGVTGICLVAFVVLASSNIALTLEYVLTDSTRVWGTWMNNIGSAIGIYLVIHVLVSDFAEHSTLELELRKGLVRGDFFLVYQPQMASDGRVVGAEA